MHIHIFHKISGTKIPSDLLQRGVAVILVN